MIWLLLVIAFVAGFALDYTWTRCVSSVQSQWPFWAANWAVLCFLCGLAPPYFLVEKNLPPLAAYALGCWVGTYIAVRISASRR
jgi:hypothetical protein